MVIIGIYDEAAGHNSASCSNVIADLAAYLIANGH
jgi:hypothetical protein